MLYKRNNQWAKKENMQCQSSKGSDKEQMTGEGEITHAITLRVSNLLKRRQIKNNLIVACMNKRGLYFS